MIPSPILKVLSTIQTHRVQALLMGGQACVFYGAAEFSRDTDLAIHATPPNLGSFENAIRDLEAARIAVPPFSIENLLRGHGVHFRCRHPDARGMRIDILSVLRGVDAFSELWARRTTVSDPDGLTYDLLSLPDLVQAKKTQRDKDWPMIRRLVEANYFGHRTAPEPVHVRFWLRELRTPEILDLVARENPALRSEMLPVRPLLAQAGEGKLALLEEALAAEERREREADRDYWKPLRAELERMRHG